ncbi:MAG: hypothetical protein LBG72_08225 [Spirochaetaceae bacterium]|jgi:hypothetical protein|nr:hypothetical protein [Spirochaetaceae bacterium]
MKYKQLVLVMAAALLPAFTGCDNPGGDSTPPDGEYGIAFVPEKFDKAVSVGYPSATERVKITNTGKKPTGPLTVSYRGGGGSTNLSLLKGEPSTALM